MNSTTSKRHAEIFQNWNILFQLKKQNTYQNEIDNLELYPKVRKIRVSKFTVLEEGGK
jgi:hypothetical protein